MGLNYADYPIIAFALFGIVAFTKLLVPIIDIAAEYANAYFGRPRRMAKPTNPQAHNFNVNRHPYVVRKSVGR